MGPDTKKQDIKVREDRINRLSKNNLSQRKCFSGASGSMEYSEAGCGKPIVLKRPEINPQYGTPLLTSAINTSMDLANAVASGDTAAADVQAANLASMAKNLETY